MGGQNQGMALLSVLVVTGESQGRAIPRWGQRGWKRWVSRVGGQRPSGHTGRERVGPSGPLPGQKMLSITEHTAQCGRGEKEKRSIPSFPFPPGRSGSRACGPEMHAVWEEGLFKKKHTIYKIKIRDKMDII